MQIDKQTVGQTGMTKVIDDFCYYANALTQ